MVITLLHFVWMKMRGPQEEIKRMVAMKKDKINVYEA